MFWSKKAEFCSEIAKAVGDRVPLFFPEGRVNIVEILPEDLHKKYIMASSKQYWVDQFISIKPADWYGIYFASLWGAEEDRVIKALKQAMLSGSVCCWVDVTDDASGVAMCHWGDRLKDKVLMPCVVDQIPYHGSVDWLQGKQLMFALFWHQDNKVRVPVEQWVTY
ncbi:hypothetical protein [Candidatus Synchoanobacter obligatus]|uniref:Uncharacterized protein n=1 Tax=Candidatus Synchoanobacter obligatus TaxID=2919597 RepID=A0ABT1L6W8_9GAMM|nr:hypothetical protein [Candidatus Synchoanobacter obligatus]MCP8352425.1 hypothetical protein [Candidatus Synchoanobacter obligatus]